MGIVEINVRTILLAFSPTIVLEWQNRKWAMK